MGCECHVTALRKSVNVAEEQTRGHTTKLSGAYRDSVTFRYKQACKDVVENWRSSAERVSASLRLAPDRRAFPREMMSTRMTLVHSSVLPLSVSARHLRKTLEASIKKHFNKRAYFASLFLVRYRNHA